MTSSRAKGEIGHAAWVCLIICVITLCHQVEAELIASRVHNHTEACVPWVCTCYMDGVYYDKGQKWTHKKYPCMLFECLDNGYYEPIVSGCNFKGNCKKHNETWTEGCFTYRCAVTGDKSRYTLVEGGCTDKKGACYKVGEQYVEFCDTYECQIDGTCFSFKKIKSGCMAKEGKCQPVLSFWHDACAVYQCTKKKGQLTSVIQTHSHDVMMWPRGNYALLEPKLSCPDVFEQFWKEGVRTRFGDGLNYYSESFNLKGNYTQKVMQHYFCVHREVNDTDLLPLYQTYWENGRYCIMRENGTCPRGFDEGMVFMLDQPNGGGLTAGRLPDGNFTNLTTTFQFCCRHDGKLEEPIVLPTRHPFVLFMKANESQCQEVRGMRHTKEFFSFDDPFNGMFRRMNGSLPRIETGDNNTLIHFCHYTPVSCGCIDRDEKFVALKDYVKKDCVKRQCREVLNNMKLLVIVEGGCVDKENDRCVAENDVWTVKHGESCYTKKCVRKESKNNKVTFEIITVGKACREGNVCHPLNYTKVLGCYQKQCQVDPVSKEPMFRVTVEGCSNGNNTCVNVGTIVKRGCIDLICNVEVSKCGLAIHKGGCNWNNTCKDVGATWIFYCSNYTCVQERKGNTYTWKAEVVMPGCSDGKKCYKEGDMLNMSCVQYKCINGKYPGFYAVGGGCYWKGRCHAPNSKWTEGCSRYNCTVFVNGTRTIRTVIPEHLGCDIGGKCVDPGSNHTTNCVTYQCISGKKDCGKRILEIRCVDPKNKTNCLKNNETFKYHCGTYKCEVKKYTRTFPMVSGGCFWKGKCHDENKTWDEGCSRYNCKITQTKKHTVAEVYPESLACNVSGTCVPSGSTYTKKCITYLCQRGGKECGLRVKDIQCENPSKKPECLKANQTIDHGCGTYICKVKKTGWSFEKLSGCSYKGKCYKDGDDLKLGCRTYKCNKSQFQKVSSGCSYNNTCYKVNETCEIGCAVYQCSESGHLRQISSGCNYAGKCRKVDEPFDEACSKGLVCRKIHINATHYSITIKGDKGCSHGKDCYKPDETFTDKKTCNTYKCHRSGQLYKTAIGCLYKDKCYDVNTGYNGDDCKKMICGGNNGFYAIPAGCMYRNVCVEANKTYEDGCTKRKCVIQLKGNVYYQSFENSYGCAKDGGCVDLEAYYINKLEKYFCEVKTCKSNGKFYTTGHKCLSSNKKCLEPGSSEKWLDKIVHAGNLFDRTCTCGTDAKPKCTGFTYRGPAKS